MNMREAVEAIDKATAGMEVLCATGVGSHQQIVARHFSWDYPRRMILTDAGHGAMGSGLPMLIGAAMERPSATPILITGDGSFCIEMACMATLREYRVPAKVFVLDNNSFGIVRQFEDLQHLDPVATIRWNPDFAGIARACKIAAFDSLRRAFDFMASYPQEPMLAHIKVDDYAVWPILEAGHAMSDMTMGPIC